MQTRHDGTDRDVEDLGRVLVGEVADVDEHDDVAEVVRDDRQRPDDVVLREPLDDVLLVSVAVARGLLEPVVQEVVTFLKRLLVRRALLAPAAVDVQVGEDPQQPGTQVRARSERAPAAKGPRVGLLDEVLGLLARRHEPPGDAVDLVRELERLLLEANAAPRLRCRPPGCRFFFGTAHGGATLAACPSRRLKRPGAAGYSAGDAAGSSWKPPRAIASSSCSRVVRASSHESVTSPIRVALADSRPS